MAVVYPLLVFLVVVWPLSLFYICSIKLHIYSAATTYTIRMERSQTSDLRLVVLESTFSKIKKTPIHVAPCFNNKTYPCTHPCRQGLEKVAIILFGPLKYFVQKRLLTSPAAPKGCVEDSLTVCKRWLWLIRCVLYQSGAKMHFFKSDCAIKILKKSKCIEKPGCCKIEKNHKKCGELLSVSFYPTRFQTLMWAINAFHRDPVSSEPKRYLQKEEKHKTGQSFFPVYKVLMPLCHGCRSDNASPFLSPTQNAKPKKVIIPLLH